MKKTFLLLILAIGLVSCEMTERLYLNENGSVKYETEMNFSQMTGFMFPEAKRDSLRQIGEFPIDTVINFADLEKFSELSQDSLSESERSFMKSMDKTKVHMVINEEEGKMVIGIEEKSIKDFNAYLKDVNNSLEKLKEDDQKSADELTQSGLLKSLELKYDGKNFQRIADNSSIKLLDELDDSTADATKQMMNMITYKMEYHYPKKVKSSSIENATFSLDGKIMTIDVPMDDYLTNPDKYNFTVEFE